ncbi:MAG TPA: LytTR family DNA-binding domain-containing protein [Kofleriaceae bacterium]|jgi:two-component system LytT family response regulator|nr:LytTR family DNA-binding domain-containing protein [Kofleriaceae bacterium]
MNVLVVDDEPLARKLVIRLLGQIPDTTIVGEAETVRDAVTRIAEVRPDLVLLDIEMPDGSGFDVLDSVEAPPAVIFTTAYDQHAVKAFEVGAIDYLLKPIELDRLAAALARIHSRFDRGLARLFVRDGARSWLVPLREVRWIASDGNYIRLAWGARELLVSRSLTAIERQLDPRRFVRANRAELVNLDFVERVIAGDGGRIDVELRGGPTVTVSRRQARVFRAFAL